WLPELCSEIIEREDAGGPLACELPDAVGVPGGGDALVAAPQQPADHVSAHATQTDHSDLHGRPPSVVNRLLSTGACSRSSLKNALGCRAKEEARREGSSS